MKKIYLLLLLVAGFAEAQVVNIPDANFKAMLLEPNNALNAQGTTITIDSNSDGEIQDNEALAVSQLGMGAFTNIADLTGIEAFTNLILLNCSLQTFTSLDVSMLSNLNMLICTDGNLSVLNISGLNNLEYIQVHSNALTVLDFSGLPNIKHIECYDNPLVSLNLDGLVSLEELVYGNPELGVVDLSTLNNLYALALRGISQTSIDLSSLTVLSSLMLFNTSLVSIDLSNNMELTDFVTIANPDLQYVNLKDGRTNPVITTSIDSSPNLLHICANDEEAAVIRAQMSDTNLCCNNYENVVINSYCSFTPGGLYNTITGKVTIDADNNGCDLLDGAYPYLKIDIDDGTVTGSSFTNSNGNYIFYTQQGNFTLTPNFENPAFFNLSPASDSVTFPEANQTVATRNFCISPNGIHPDLEVILTANPIRPGFNTYQNLVYRNKGNQLASGNVTYTFDGTLLDLISANPAPDSQSTNTLTWNYTNLSPFETRGINLVLRANAPTDTPPLNTGNQLVFSTTINPVGGDETPADNVFTNNIVTVNSFDPNAKTCLEGTNVLPENIGKYLHYNINFENLGTADAINVVVKDTIDTTRFDINSLQLLYASHPVYPKITGNVVEFIFEGINLPPSIMNPIGGHGNVLFKIKTLPTLAVGDEVSNTANIYFDYNHPIDTNEARTAFNNLSKTDFVKDDSVTVYPNPAKNKVTVKATGTIKSVQLYDVQGRILQSVADSKSQVTLDIANQQRGVYFLRITTDKGNAVEKIIKD